MPQGTKKNNKGRTPAHQNTFAFRHNPKSIKTQQILASPNVHVCRRCFDKIEWRKQYRKYKPRTQPGKCNACQRRTVTAAYHTICESCTRTSSKAQTLLQEWNNDAYKRVCGVCVKEPALPDPSMDEPQQELMPKGKIRLRELKTLERQREKAAATQRQQTDPEETKDDIMPVEQEEKDGSGSEIDNVDDVAEPVVDPFLQAVGGADKLLTGEAYQQMLLQKQMEQAQTTDQN